MLNQTENHQQFDWNQNEFAFCEKQKNHLNNVRKYCRKQKTIIKLSDYGIMKITRDLD